VTFVAAVDVDNIPDSKADAYGGTVDAAVAASGVRIQDFYTVVDTDLVALAVGAAATEALGQVAVVEAERFLEHASERDFAPGIGVSV
jgi:hypothetical protein